MVVFAPPGLVCIYYIFEHVILDRRVIPHTHCLQAKERIFFIF
jgi:hypothetical protein